MGRGDAENPILYTASLMYNHFRDSIGNQDVQLRELGHRPPPRLIGRHLPLTHHRAIGVFLHIHVHSRVLTLRCILLLDLKLPFLRQMVEICKTMPRFLNRRGDIDRGTREPQHFVRLWVPVEVFRYSGVSVRRVYSHTGTMRHAPVSGGSFSKITFCDPTAFNPPTALNIDRSSFVFPPWDDAVRCICAVSGG